MNISDRLCLLIKTLFLALKMVDLHMETFCIRLLYEILPHRALKVYIF